jgi:hypothetical protein
MYEPDEVRFHVKEMIESRRGKCIEGNVHSIDTAKRTLELEIGSRIDYFKIVTGKQIFFL